MLHLSLITLPRDTPQWRFLRPYELHQILWKGFKGLKRGERENRFLYRHQEAGEVHSILVQSATAPDWSFLADEASGTRAETRPFNTEGIDANDRLHFLLRANPVVSRRFVGEKKRPDDKYDRQRRIAVGSDRERLAKLLGKEKDDLPSREDMLIQWLERKGMDGGFVIERGEKDRILCDIGPNMDIILRKPEQKEKDERVTLTTVDFSGVLRVTDADAFAQTLRHGLGRARAFGCGLLSVRRM